MDPRPAALGWDADAGAVLISAAFPWEAGAGAARFAEAALGRAGCAAGFAAGELLCAGGGAAAGCCVLPLGVHLPWLAASAVHGFPLPPWLHAGTGAAIRAKIATVHTNTIILLVWNSLTRVTSR